MTPHFAVLCGAIAAWFVVRRRFVAAMICAAGALSGLVGTLPGRSLSVSANGAAETVALLVFNARVENATPERAHALLLDTQADVVVLLEPSATLLDALRSDEVLRRRLPHRWLPDRAGPGFMVVLSAWPQRAGRDWDEGPAATVVRGTREMLVDRPQGAFALLAIHPDSPRSHERWRTGNQTVEDAAARVRDRLVPTGLPVVVAGDLNSPPMGARVRALCKGTGLRSAKPLLVPAGTYPGGWRWPFSLAIDDALVSAGVGVTGWRTLEGAGSDHAPVLIRLVIPVSAASE
ncbi:MAG: endonuclease/exonuclease/phosphatase family protein [Phycisphaeraceae bacterium]|nr:endonuclease/exonuclease/phosphatase family protein [Phycisphaeraceae bacterium]